MQVHKVETIQLSVPSDYNNLLAMWIQNHG